MVFAERERICPVQTGLLVEITGMAGSALTEMVVTSVADPQELVTVSEMGALVAELKQTAAGSNTSAVFGVPPGKVHS